MAREMNKPYLVLMICVLITLQFQFVSIHGQTAGALPETVQVSTSQITLSAGEHQKAQLNFGKNLEVYSMGVRDDGFFVTHDQKDVMTIDAVGNVNAFTSVFSAKTIATENLIVNNYVQWGLAALDMFTSVAPADINWSRNETMSCNGLNMLQLKHGEASKKFKGLPPHQQMRIEAVVHYIDDWQGEATYLKVDGNYVWTGGHDQRNSPNTLSVCGLSKFAESQFSVIIDVTVPHKSDSVLITFGTTIPDDAEETIFAISSVGINVRKISL